MIDLRAIFFEAVQAASDMPASVRDAVGKTVVLRKKKLEQSYLDFLDEQIRLCPRGEEWNTILKKRRMMLKPFVGKELIECDGPVDGCVVWIKVDPLSKRVLYWEKWDPTDCRQRPGSAN